MSNATEGWAEYWEQEGAGGEVFVNARGDRHPALADFWSAVFAGLSSDARIIDLASGAGSIFGHLGTDHGFKLTAADISAEALDTLASRVRGAETIVCPADAVPRGDGSFDLVVSQFGIEYAGRDAFAEAARLVAGGGRLVSLTHIRGGYIDSRNKAQLVEAELVRDSGFIDLCLEVINAAYSKSPPRIQKAEAQFLPVAQRIDAGIGRCRQGVHTHLFAGFRQLFERRREYDKADITGWLDGMRGEVDRAISRLSHMRAAAMSGDDTQAIRELLVAAGLVDVGVDTYFTPGNEEAVAWQITASRPQ